MRGSYRSVVVLCLLVAAGLILGACSALGGIGAGGGETGAPVVAVEAGENGLTVPADIPSGIVTMQMPPEADGLMGRLNEGVTLDQLNEALAAPDPLAALGLISLVGGSSSAIDHQVTYDLKQGDYAIVGFSPDGPPALTPFTTGAASGAAAPAADIKVDLADFSFVAPTEIQTGRQTWRISNQGTQWHEMAIVKLAEGQTVESLMADIAAQGEGGPPQLDDVAFWSPISPGETAWVDWDLPPGTYTMLCFLPDLSGDGAPHATKGMVGQITVTD